MVLEKTMLMDELKTAVNEFNRKVQFGGVLSAVSGNYNPGSRPPLDDETSFYAYERVAELVQILSIKDRGHGQLSAEHSADISLKANLVAALRKKERPRRYGDIITRLRVDLNKFYDLKSTGESMEELADNRVIPDAMCILVKYPLMIANAGPAGQAVENEFRDTYRCIAARHSALKNALHNASEQTLSDHFPVCRQKNEELRARGVGKFERQRDLIDVILEHRGCEHPLKMINDYLSDVDFNYRFFRDPHGVGDDKYYFHPLGDKSIGVPSSAFSSGENMLLKMIAFKCKISLISDRQRPHIHVLDEMDKHFHPRFTEHFIKIVRDLVMFGAQVFGTTHRLDTLTLAYDDEIFFMKPQCMAGGKLLPRISACNKLLAMSRLARNLSSYMGRRTVVYTEGDDDPRFYRPMYKLIKRFAFAQRQASKRAASQERSLVQLSQISMRYQMEFRSVENADGKHGGASSVWRAVDITSKYQIGESLKMCHSAMNHMYNASLFEQYGVDGTFGLIDKDYRYNHKGPSKTKTESEQCQQDRIVSLKRNTIENFIFDPMMMCSLIESEYHRQPLLMPLPGEDADIRTQFRKRMINLSIELKSSQSYNRITWTRRVQCALDKYVLALYRICLAYRNMPVAVFASTIKPLIVRQAKAKISGSSGKSGRNQSKNKQDRKQKLIARIQDDVDEFLTRIGSLPLANVLLAAKCLKNGSSVGFEVLGKNPADIKSQHEEDLRKFARISWMQLHTILAQAMGRRKPINKFTEDVYLRMSQALAQGHRGESTAHEYYFSREDRDKKASLDSQIVVVKFNIPSVLKDIQGHDLEYALLGPKRPSNVVSFRNWICEEIDRVAMLDDVSGILLPKDLLDTYFELNARIRSQMVSQAKLLKWQNEIITCESPEAAMRMGHYLPHAFVQSASQAKPPASAASSEAESTSYFEDMKINYAILQSQRNIKRVHLGESADKQRCKVLNAPADGNCGLHAIRQYLVLKGEVGLASCFTPEAFIQLVCDYRVRGDGSMMNSYQEIIDEYRGVDFDPVVWKKEFSARWLEMKDLRLLSAIYNIEFKIFNPGSNAQQGFFVAGRGERAVICETTRDLSTLTVALAHVSTVLLSRAIDFNHFDTLVIEPTLTEEERILKFNLGAIEEKDLAPGAAADVHAHAAERPDHARGGEGL